MVDFFFVTLKFTKILGCSSIKFGGKLQSFQ